MTPLYYKFACHLLSFLSDARLLLLGDPFQRIFSFNGSSDCYLLHPDKYFGEQVSGGEFHQKNISISWRITPDMADWINHNLHPRALKSAKDTPQWEKWWEENGPPLLKSWGSGLKGNPKKRKRKSSSGEDVEMFVSEFCCGETLLHRINKLYKTKQDDELALLAYSLKSQNSPTQVLTRKLGSAQSENWAILADLGNSEKMTDEELSGKRIASTIHRFKGLELPIIVVLSFDSFYEKFVEPLELFNLYYVACTRATEKLIVVQESREQPYLTLRGGGVVSAGHDGIEGIDCEVVEFTRYKSFDEILDVFSLSSRKVKTVGTPFIFEKGDFLVEGRGDQTKENISVLTSLLLDIILDFHLGRLHSRLKSIMEPLRKAETIAKLDPSRERVFDENLFDFLEEKIDQPYFSNAELFRLAALEFTFRCRYHHLWRQIKTFEKGPSSSKISRSIQNILLIFQSLFGWEQTIEDVEVEKKRKMREPESYLDLPPSSQKIAQQIKETDVWETRQNLQINFACLDIKGASRFNGVFLKSEYRIAMVRPPRIVLLVVANSLQLDHLTNAQVPASMKWLSKFSSVLKELNEEVSVKTEESPKGIRNNDIDGDAEIIDLTFEEEKTPKKQKTGLKALIERAHEQVHDNFYRAYVILANLGELHEVKLDLKPVSDAPLHFEFFYRQACRKCGRPSPTPQEISNQFHIWVTDLLFEEHICEMPVGSDLIFFPSPPTFAPRPDPAPSKRMFKSNKIKKSHSTGLSPFYPQTKQSFGKPQPTSIPELKRYGDCGPNQKITRPKDESPVHDLGQEPGSLPPGRPKGVSLVRDLKPLSSSQNIVRSSSMSSRQMAQSPVSVLEPLKPFQPQKKPGLKPEPSSQKIRQYPPRNSRPKDESPAYDLRPEPRSLLSTRPKNESTVCDLRPYSLSSSQKIVKSSSMNSQAITQSSVSPMSAPKPLEPFQPQKKPPFQPQKKSPLSFPQSYPRSNKPTTEFPKRKSAGVSCYDGQDQGASVPKKKRMFYGQHSSPKNQHPSSFPFETQKDFTKTPPRSNTLDENDFDLFLESLKHPTPPL